jgi:hypothetical protein
MTKGEYVADCVRAARLAAEDLALRGAERVVDVARVERARKYAEWRWDGIQSGEVASL